MPTDDVHEFFIQIKRLLVSMVMMPEEGLRDLRQQVQREARHSSIPNLAPVLSQMVDGFIRAGDDHQRRDQLAAEFWDRLSQIESLMNQRRAAPEAGASREDD